MIEEPAARLGLALAIGLLVGLERGWREREQPDRSRTAGIRTYGLCGLLGGSFALLADAFGAPSVFAGAFVAFAAILTLFMLREALADRNFSVTALLAGLAVFALGALAIVGDYRVAAGGGAALAAVLASREALHGLLRRMTWEELRAALILAVMTAIVLPLLPDRTIDPWNGVNPWEIWLFTILVATLSYSGYVAMRVLGRDRGLMLASLLGAIVSSTAVTVALARRSERAPGALAGAASLAAAVSISRVCLITAAVAPAVLGAVAFPALSAVSLFVAAGLLLLGRNSPDGTEAIELTNPFQLAPLLGFAASFAVIAAVSAMLTDTVGAKGMLAASAISGTFDVDVAVLSALRQLAQAPHAAPSVSDAVMAALAANAAGRALLASLAGGWRFAVRYLAISLAAALVGASVYLLLPGSAAPF